LEPEHRNASRLPTGEDGSERTDMDLLSGRGMTTELGLLERRDHRFALGTAEGDGEVTDDVVPCEVPSAKTAALVRTEKAE
jgi:hypothetical protein